eukprot:CAMPEP_0197725158 /NCGR_PEP_ID=MMETSP1434-20131217/6801_1 /TAXON_ID=265543 /ORGANISM="Minutocellus polymorphus, Strain CCMP3303" /LENGTH=283 /DNA_ID=CAMNT_0043310607 /DNA_START=16 /DNA_END=867 /DNA_ORIENTATION=-
MPQYKSYLLIENSSKGNNLGPLLRCACAFRVTEVIFVGFAQCSTEGSHGSARHVPIRAFTSFEQAEKYLRGADCGVVDIVGVLGGTWNHRSSSAVDAYDDCEISEYDHTSDVNGSSVVRRLVTIASGDAVIPTFRRVCESGGNASHNYPTSIPVYRRQFRGNTAFLCTKNWRGLPAEQARICDSFLHVPHLATEEPCQAMFVDIQSIISIVFHHFTAWAQYDERESEGQKFDVAVYQKGQISEQQKTEKAAKRAKIREASGNVLEELASASSGIFGGGDDGDY